MKRANLAVLIGACLWSGLSLYLSLSAYAADEALARAARLNRTGRYEQAEQVVSRWTLTPPSAALVRARGNALRLKGLFRQDGVALRAGLAQHERAARLNPLDADLHLDLAWAALQLGDPTRAEAAARAALARDPHNAYVLYTLGRIQERQGLYAEAAASYRRALAARRDPQVAARLRDLETP